MLGLLVLIGQFHLKMYRQWDGAEINSRCRRRNRKECLLCVLAVSTVWAKQSKCIFGIFSLGAGNGGFKKFELHHPFLALFVLYGSYLF